MLTQYVGLLKSIPRFMLIYTTEDSQVRIDRSKLISAMEQEIGVLRQNDSFEAQLELRTLDHLVGHRRISLLKVDCEGCEWETLKSAKKALRRVPMIKIELVQNDYTAGNETMTAHQIIKFLHNEQFDLYADHWNEQSLYFGLHHKEQYDIDKLFGSEKFNLPHDVNALHHGAHLILSNPIDPETFNQKEFLKHHTDVIAIERGLSERMKAKWVPAVTAS
eukprot:CAMPEP_0175036630 /NCGR_PEP_ID=MMETSP0005-20121125/23893_1 /TAXON_ID=420556 /ORGANISM="Ochromonas sp., Strain CCMP1393" /LENGTH=219 /DNA_ID=CAMNT_0016297843 /DNA_START=424 /DNA_END=1084 /DNA_ORIENTATION=+